MSNMYNVAKKAVGVLAPGAMAASKGVRKAVNMITQKPAMASRLPLSGPRLAGQVGKAVKRIGLMQKASGAAGMGKMSPNMAMRQAIQKASPNGVAREQALGRLRSNRK